MGWEEVSPGKGEISCSLFKTCLYRYFYCIYHSLQRHALVVLRIQEWHMNKSCFS